jgi:hypothetical protein
VPRNQVGICVRSCVHVGAVRCVRSQCVRMPTPHAYMKIFCAIGRPERGWWWSEAGAGPIKATFSCGARGPPVCISAGGYHFFLFFFHQSLSQFLFQKKIRPGVLILIHILILILIHFVLILIHILIQKMPLC